MKNFLPLILVFTMACGEFEDVPEFDVETVEGMRPIYVDPDQLSIGLESPRAISLAGKIYSYGDLLLVNEIGLGFHIFDNSDPVSPVNLRFVSVPGNHDMAVKEGIVYADNFSDLVALEITSDTVRVIKRLPGLIGSTAKFPPQKNVYFECIDESKGLIIGWETASLNNPQCYRP